MKKQITAIITAALILGGLTACSKQVPNNQPGTPNSVTDSVLDTFGDSSSTSSENSINSSSTESEPAEKKRYVYGETEIPNVPELSGICEGRTTVDAPYDSPDKFAACLDLMEFESHTLGEYTIKLVGDGVRTDKENFPGYIYTHYLRIEVMKNGVKIGTYNENEDYGYDAWVIYVPQYNEEFRLLESEIGNYIDLYDLERPVIVRRYWFDDDPRRLVTKCMSFAEADYPYNGSSGAYEAGLGVSMSRPSLSAPFDILKPANGKIEKWGYWGIFESSELKVVDKNTLVDEKAGVKYVFDFTDVQKSGWYTAERID